LMASAISAFITGRSSSVARRFVNILKTRRGAHKRTRDQASSPASPEATIQTGA
jgi:hypothetical protein